MEIVKGGPGRVTPVNRATIVKFAMSTDGAQYRATKLRPTLTPLKTSGADGGQATLRSCSRHSGCDCSFRWKMVL